jgi:hypothetical protein
MSAALAGAVVTIAAMPAQAAWKSYVNRELGFAFMAPGDVKAAVGNFRGNFAGPRQTIVYRSVEDNIEYKVTVMSFLQAGSATLSGRQYMLDGKKVLTDAFAQVGRAGCSLAARLSSTFPTTRAAPPARSLPEAGSWRLKRPCFQPKRFASPDVSRFID